VLHYTKRGASSTENLINHLKSQHRIQVILESEGHNTTPTQKEIGLQIVIKEMSLFEATKKRSNNLAKTVPCLTYKQTHISGTTEGFFSNWTICHTKLRSSVNDESML